MIDPFWFVLTASAAGVVVVRFIQGLRASGPSLAYHWPVFFIALACFTVFGFMVFAPDHWTAENYLGFECLIALLVTVLAVRAGSSGPPARSLALSGLLVLGLGTLALVLPASPRSHFRGLAVLDIAVCLLLLTVHRSARALPLLDTVAIPRFAVYFAVLAFYHALIEFSGPAAGAFNAVATGIYCWLLWDLAQALDSHRTAWATSRA